MTTLLATLEQVAAAHREGKRVRAVLHPSTKGDAVAYLLGLCGVDVSRSVWVREGEAGVFVDQGIHHSYTYKCRDVVG